MLVFIKRYEIKENGDIACLFCKLKTKILTDEFLFDKVFRASPPPSERGSKIFVFNLGYLKGGSKVKRDRTLPQISSFYT